MPDASSTALEFERRLDALTPLGESPPMRDIFALANEFIDLAPIEIEALLESSRHETRVGAVSVMDFQARSSKTNEARKADLFDLYLRRHDRINTWDLVDRAAPWVVGAHLLDKSRDPLCELAKSNRWYERRSAIVATFAFIRKGEIDDTFAIGDLLAHDPENLVQKAVGGWVREAGKSDQGRLLEFLDRHARTMPRTALRYAIEKLDPELRQHYLQLGRN